MAELDFPPNTAFPDPLVNDQAWQDPNGVDWIYKTDKGWLKTGVVNSINDPNVHAGQSAGSINLGEESTVMTGINNTILGLTGSAMSTGANNVLVGQDAGENLDQANNNTIVGQDAAKDMNNALSHNNVIVGKGALASNTHAINCVVVGEQARPAANGDQNSIAIGSGAIGAGPNTAVIGDANIILTLLRGAVQTGSHTLASLPTATTPGQIIWVSDATAVAGGCHCSSNGTNWVIMGTATPVT